MGEWPSCVSGQYWGSWILSLSFFGMRGSSGVHGVYCMEFAVPGFLLLFLLSLSLFLIILPRSYVFLGPVFLCPVCFHLGRVTWVKYILAAWR